VLNPHEQLRPAPSELLHTVAAMPLAGVPVGIDGVTPLGGADTIVNKSAEDVLRRLPVRLHEANRIPAW
jgi:hypothetical protein